MVEGAQIGGLESLLLTAIRRNTEGDGGVAVAEGGGTRGSSVT